MIALVQVLFQDEHLLAVNKPSGLLVHRGWGDDSVVAMTLARDLIGRHVYPLHRLDRGTSGVLLFALDPEVAAVVQASFTSQQVNKVYRALVRGVPPDELLIDHPIPKGEDGPRVEARTSIRRLFTKDRYSWIEARPLTGRLHQIRRHLKHISHPVIGDVNYGKGEHNRFFRSQYGLHRLALHALRMTLPHPISGAELVIEADIPEDLSGPIRAWSAPERILAH